MLLNTFIINMKVGYLWYSGMMSVSIHGNYAVYYVLSMEGEVKTFITIKALVDPVSLEFPSVTPKVKAAVWGELNYSICMV